MPFGHGYARGKQRGKERVIIEGGRVQVNKGVQPKVTGHAITSYFTPFFTPYPKGVLSYASPVTFGDGIGGTGKQRGTQGVLPSISCHLWLYPFGVREA